MLQQHRALVLNQLGISHWIGRDTPHHAIETYSLWRDESWHEEQHDGQNVDQIETPAKTEIDETTHLNQNDRLIQADVPQAWLDELVTSATETDLNRIVAEPAPLSPEEIPTFSQQVQFEFVMCRHEKMLLLSQIHSPEQQQLWVNILQSLHAHSESVQWPPQLEWTVYDDLIPYYLKGIFSSQNRSTMPKVLCLGENPVPNTYFDALAIAQSTLPSLHDCLHDPLAKQQVWQAIYHALYQV